MSLDIRDHKSGATLRLAVRPGAGRTEIRGEHDGALRLAVAAPPEKGKANKAALQFLARTLSLSPADIEIIGGETSRKKVVFFRVLGAEELGARLEKLLD